MKLPDTAAEREVRDLEAILAAVKPLTTTPRDALIDLARLVRAVLRFDIPGDFVECGSYAGGAGFLMAYLLREAGARDRKVWLFDSFEGLPAPEPIDGRAALEYATQADSEENYDNCRALFEEVQRNAEALGLTEFIVPVKGWFEETLPKARDRIGPIAVLRVDGNWHASVRCSLDNLYEQVSDDGFVICHTYYTYDGCAVAVHEFLGERRLPYRIEPVTGRREGEPIEDYRSALFRKGEPSWKWLRQVYLTTCEIEALVPSGQTFVVADQQELGMVFTEGRTALPFVERNGEYWGAPEDDAAAIAELERMRVDGASLIAFAWPAFWWLDYYAGLNEHLRLRYPCVQENARVVVFDLRLPK